MINIFIGVIALFLVVCLNYNYEITTIGNKKSVGYFIVGVCIGILIIPICFEKLNFVRNSRTNGIVKRYYDHISLSKYHPKNLLILDGGSHTSTAIDGTFLEGLISANNYSVKVIQISGAGMTHFERYVIHKRLVSKLENETSLLDDTNIILAFEISPGYNSIPLISFIRNYDSLRSVDCMDTSSFFVSLYALFNTSGFLGVAKNISKIAAAWLRNRFNIGLFQHAISFNNIAGVNGFFSPQNKRLEYNDEKIQRIIENTQVEISFDFKDGWIDCVRTPRVIGLYGEDIQMLKFYPPDLIPSGHAYARHKQQATPDQIVIIPPIELMRKLGRKELWRNVGHMNFLGAQIYTPWLAGQLLQSGVLER